MRLRFNRHKTFSTVLNVIGLTLAFSVFLILTVQVVYDTRYDLNYPDTDKIVRLEYSDPTSPGVYGVQLSRPFIENLKTFFPQAEAVSCYWYYKNGNRSPFKEANTETPGIMLRYTQTDFDLLRVFPFEFIEGDTSGYRAPGTAVISQKAAAKVFGSQSPVGKDIQFDTKSGDGSSWRIVAVYKDFPDNSSMDNDLLLNLGDYCMTNYSEWNYPCYMKMNTFEGVEPLLDSLGAMMFGEDSEFKDQVDFRLSHLHDAYYARDVEGDNMAKGNRTTTMTLLTVSILVLLIAIINFVNFAMASVPFSIKSINTRRVIGSTRGQQIWAQLWRALGLVLLAFALSVGMMSLAATSSIASNISGSLRVADNLPIILIGLGVAVVTAFIAGIFPARYSTSFNPAMVLKGSFSLSAKGRKMRSVLVGFQYVISFILILCSLFITVQIKYMKNYDMGFDREQTVEFFVSNKIGNSRETLRQMLLENPNIADVTFAGNRVISQGKMGWGRTYQGQRVQMDCLPVDPNFVSFFGMQIAEGRDFTESDNLNPNGTFIVNQAFMAKYPFLRLGLKFSGHQGDDMPAEIVGIVKDFNFQPLQYSVAPIVLYNFGSEPWWPLTVGYAKVLPGNVQETFKFIREKCAELDPTFDTSSMGLYFMDEGIGRLYEKEDNLNRLITTAALISLLISVIGILGLVYFETQFRRKEIAVRRVHGASVGEILAMLNRYYLIITLVCFVVAVPVAIVIIRAWVSGFPYQSPVPVWIFLAALLIIGLITIVTVTLQSRRAALRNPVESIANE